MKSAVVCMYISTFSTHYNEQVWMHYAVGLCLRTHGLLNEGSGFPFAYNCKNTVKFNNHIAFFPSFFIIYLKKRNVIVQILNRT